MLQRCLNAGSTAVVGDSALGSGIGGSITTEGVGKVVDSMTSHCKLGADSVVCDLGAGIGRPLLQMAVSIAPRVTFGIELDELNAGVRYGGVLNSVLKHPILGSRLASASLPYVQQGDFTLCKPPLACFKSGLLVTHVYSFCAGMPQGTMGGIGNLISMSPCIKGFALVMHHSHNILKTLHEFGFPNTISLVDSIIVRQCGSGAQYRAYVFSR